MRYSESFKLQAVRAPEEGHYSSGCASKQAHGILGAETVRRRAWHYGQEHVTGRVIRVETPEEHNELWRLKERVRDLERAMGDAALDLRLERAYAKLACRKAGKDVEELKKGAWEAVHDAIAANGENPTGGVEGLCRRAGMSRWEY